MIDPSTSEASTRTSRTSASRRTSSRSRSRAWTRSRRGTCRVSWSRVNMSTRFMKELLDAMQDSLVGAQATGHPQPAEAPARLLLGPWRMRESHHIRHPREPHTRSTASCAAVDGGAAGCDLVPRRPEVGYGPRLQTSLARAWQSPTSASMRHHELLACSIEISLGEFSFEAAASAALDPRCPGRSGARLPRRLLRARRSRTPAPSFTTRARATRCLGVRPRRGQFDGGRARGHGSARNHGRHSHVPLVARHRGTAPRGPVPQGDGVPQPERGSPYS